MLIGQRLKSDWIKSASGKRKRTVEGIGDVRSRTTHSEIIPLNKRYIATRRTNGSALRQKSACVPKSWSTSRSQISELIVDWWGIIRGQLTRWNAHIHEVRTTNSRLTS